MGVSCLEVSVKFFSLIIVLIIFSVEANENSIFEAVALNSEYLTVDEHTEIKSLGLLSNGYKIYNYRHYFNNGDRVSTRIVAINRHNELIGIYGVNDWAIHLTEHCIIFSYPIDEGNSICLKSGKLPKQAWIDGENPTLFK